jgi:hypothetical protein
MTNQRVCSALLLSVCLAGCGASTDGPQPPPPVEETAFGDVVSPMDKARNVEDVTLGQKQALDRALEQQEGGGQ